MVDPTRLTYTGLTEAYDFFNKSLFNGKLPRCLITMQRQPKCRGFFAPGRFGAADGTDVVDEIALNPNHFRERTTRQILSTLVHEMCHLEQQHFGTPPRRAYHDKEWAKMMAAVGLISSDTGEPGGKTTGAKITHYIADGGPFDKACTELEGTGYAVRYVDLWGEATKLAAEKKKASKTKYTCGGCGCNAWAKPETNLMCGDCEERMEPEDGEG